MRLSAGAAVRFSRAHETDKLSATTTPQPERERDGTARRTNNPRQISRARRRSEIHSNRPRTGARRLVVGALGNFPSRTSRARFARSVATDTGQIAGAQSSGAPRGFDFRNGGNRYNCGTAQHGGTHLGLFYCCRDGADFHRDNRPMRRQRRTMVLG